MALTTNSSTQNYTNKNFLITYYMALEIIYLKNSRATSFKIFTSLLKNITTKNIFPCVRDALCILPQKPKIKPPYNIHIMIWNYHYKIFSSPNYVINNALFLINPKQLPLRYPYRDSKISPPGKNNLGGIFL